MEKSRFSVQALCIALDPLFVIKMLTFYTNRVTSFVIVLIEARISPSVYSRNCLKTQTMMQHQKGRNREVKS